MGRTGKVAVRRFTFSLLAGCFVLALCFALPGIAGEPLAADLRFEKLVVEKKKSLLTAYAKGKAVRVYRVALGDPVGPKRVQGDKKAPKACIT